MFGRLDGKLLKSFQKISDWLQTWFGINNFWLAKLFLTLAVFSFFSEGIERFYSGSWTWSTILSVCMALPISIIIWRYIAKAEWSCKNNPVFTNPNVFELQTWRLLGIFGLIITILMLTTEIFSNSEKEKHMLLAGYYYKLYRFVFFFCVYFASCTPKPPSKSKVKKIKEKVSETVGLVPKLSITNNSRCV